MLRCYIFVLWSKKFILLKMFVIFVIHSLFDPNTTTNVAFYAFWLCRFSVARCSDDVCVTRPTEERRRIVTLVCEDLVELALDDVDVIIVHIAPDFSVVTLQIRGETHPVDVGEVVEILQCSAVLVDLFLADEVWGNVGGFHPVSSNHWEKKGRRPC